MNSKHLLSASGDILGEKVAGSVNQGLKRNPWYCNPRNTCAMESWSRFIFCRDQTMYKPREHSPVFVLECVLPGRNPDFKHLAPGPSQVKPIFNRD